MGRERAGAELELVHDSLICSWKPLVRWLEQNREEVVFLDEVSRAAELWDSRGRPSEEVWTGEALDVASAKIKRCEAVPNRVREFIDAAILQRQLRVSRRRKLRFAIVGTLLTVIAVMALMIRATVIQQERAETLLAEAREQRDRERSARSSSLREGARAAFAQRNYLEARAQLRASLEMRDSTQARALWWLLEHEPLVWSESLGGFVNWVSVSPDGRLIAASVSEFIHIYDTKTLDKRVLGGYNGQVWRTAFSPDGRWLSSGSGDGDIRFVDIMNGTTKVLKGHSNIIRDTNFSPDSKRLVSGSRDSTVKVWDIESGSVVQTLEHEAVVYCVRFSSNGRFIISVTRSTILHIWNAQSYEIDQIIEEPDLRIFDAVTSADGKLLAYGSMEGVLVVRDLEKRSEITRVSGSTKGIISLNFSPNGDFIAASTDDGKVLVWDTKNWSIQSSYSHKSKRVNSVSFLPDGEQFVSAGDDGTLNLWKNGVDSFEKNSGGHDGTIYSNAFRPDGKTIVTGGGDGNLFIWDVASGQPIRKIEGNDAAILNLEFHRKGNLLASASYDGSIRLWNITDGTLLKTLFGHGAAVNRVLFSSDGKQIISSSNDKTIAFWDLESLIQHKSLAMESAVTYIDFDPDGRLLATANPHKVDVRSFETAKIHQTFVGHNGRITSIEFSPDGKSLFSSSFDGTVRRYQLGSSLAEGEVVARHKGPIYQIDLLASTGQYLGTPSADQTAKIWNMENGKVLTLEGHQDEVNTLRFSPDGSYVATVSDDSTIRLWDTQTGRPFWRAPLILEEPQMLCTQQGWITFENDEQPVQSTKHWQKAVHARGRLASSTTCRQTLCLATFDQELEIWDISNDERTFKGMQSGVQQVIALRNGCLTRSEGTLTLTRKSGERVSLGKGVEAMSRLDDSLIILQDGIVRILDLDGNRMDEFPATSNVTALTIAGDRFVLGFTTGRIEVWKRERLGSQRLFACRDVSSNPVTRVIPGPPGTIIAGYSDGTVGIWSLDTGERLYTQRLHGPVVHLLHREKTLYAVSELGSRLRLELSTFYTSYCGLLERVWSSVPWIWEDGRARYREIPSDHECTPRR